MNKNNPHKQLRSSWRSEVFRSPKTKGVVIVNQSRGRNMRSSVVKVEGSFLPSAARGNYTY